MCPREDSAIPSPARRPTTVYAGAEVDVNTAVTFRAQMQTAFDHSSGPLVVNLDETTFLDSSGIRELVLMWKQCRAAMRRLTLVTNQPDVLTLLKVSGVDRLLPVQRAPAP